jgi:hypothetical protein
MIDGSRNICAIWSLIWVRARGDEQVEREQREEIDHRHPQEQRHTPWMAL